MAYAHFDISPITAEEESDYERRRSRYYVSLHSEFIFVSEWSSFWHNHDLDQIKREWTAKWEEFQVTQFKKWLADGEKTEETSEA